MRIRRVFRTDSTGAASLLVTIIMGFLLIAVVASLSVISNRESQQSSDVDLSAKAFSISESGIQKDAFQINSNPAYEQDSCNSAPGVNNPPQPETLVDPNSAITCSIVSPTSTQSEQSLNQDQTVQFNLTNAPVSAMLLQWGTTSPHGNQPPSSILNNGSCPIPSNFPTNTAAPDNSAGLKSCIAATANGWKLPSILEMTFIWWPKNSAATCTSGGTGTCFTAANLAADSNNGNTDLSMKTFMVVPYQNLTGTNERIDQAGNSGNLTAQSGILYPGGDPGYANDSGTFGGIVNACNPDFTYTITSNIHNCAVGIVSSTGGTVSVSPLPFVDAIPTQASTGNLLEACATIQSCNIILRITARYASTQLVTEFFNGSTPVSIQQPNTTIDVTARVNDLYRRTVAIKPVLPQMFDFAGNAIFSNGPICKTLTVDSGFNNISHNTCS